MWQKIKIHMTCGSIKVEAFVVGDWAAHRMIGVPAETDRGYDWTITHVPTGMRVDSIGSTNAPQAIRAAIRLGRDLAAFDLDDIVAEPWLVTGLIAQAIDEAIATEGR